MMSRRALLGAVLAGRGWKVAICSETFPGMKFPDLCRAAVRIGYTGLEIDPSNLGADPAALTAGERKSIRAAMKDAGIAYVGLHSFLKAPAGLHLTTPDAAVRRQSWEYFDRMIDLAADLGSNAVMVLGSGRQRQAIDGTSPGEAARRLEEGLASVAAHAASRKVTILLEPLAPHLCNVVNTMDEAVGIVERIGSRAVSSMFDTHNTTGEKLPLEDVIRKHAGRIRHVHLNELDGRYPGAGKFPFDRVLRTLGEVRYNGWLSVEVFDFKPDGETVARLSLEHIRRAAK